MPPEKSETRTSPTPPTARTPYVVDAGAKLADVLCWADQTKPARYIGTADTAHDALRLATELNRLHAERADLLNLAEGLVSDREAAGIDETNADDPLAALVRRARALIASVRGENGGAR